MRRVFNNGWGRRSSRQARRVRQQYRRKDRALLEVQIDQRQMNALRRDLKKLGRDFDAYLPTMVARVQKKSQRILQRLVDDRIGTRLKGKPRSTGTTAKSVGRVTRVYAQIGGKRVWGGVGIIDGPRPNVASSRNLQRQDVHGWVEFGSRTQSGSKKRPRYYIRDAIRAYPPQLQVNDATQFARRLVDRSLSPRRWRGRA